MAVRRFDPYNDPNPDDMKWLVYYYSKGPSKIDRLKKWLEIYSPSKVKQDDGFGWIAVRNLQKDRDDDFDDDDDDNIDDCFISNDKNDDDDDYWSHLDGLGDDGADDDDDEEDDDDETDELNELQKSWEKHQKAQLPVKYESIKKLAIKHNQTVGKWILLTDQGGKVDHLWSLIALTVAADDNPCISAKVSAYQRETNHVICIYNKDFTNMDEVLESEKAIRQMGIKCKLQYKPDVYTYLFIYAKNKWNLKPYIMKSQYDLLTQSSIIEKFI